MPELVDGDHPPAGPGAAAAQQRRHRYDHVGLPCTHSSVPHSGRSPRRCRARASVRSRRRPRPRRRPARDQAGSTPGRPAGGSARCRVVGRRRHQTISVHAGVQPRADAHAAAPGRRRAASRPSLRQRDRDRGRADVAAAAGTSAAPSPGRCRAARTARSVCTARDLVDDVAVHRSAQSTLGRASRPRRRRRASRPASSRPLRVGAHAVEVADAQLVVLGAGPRDATDDAVRPRGAASARPSTIAAAPEPSVRVANSSKNVVARSRPVRRAASIVASCIVRRVLAVDDQGVVDLPGVDHRRGELHPVDEPEAGVGEVEVHGTTSAGPSAWCTATAVDGSRWARRHRRVDDAARPARGRRPASASALAPAIAAPSANVTPSAHQRRSRIPASLSSSPGRSRSRSSVGRSRSSSSAEVTTRWRPRRTPTGWRYCGGGTSRYRSLPSPPSLPPARSLPSSCLVRAVCHDPGRADHPRSHAAPGPVDPGPWTRARPPRGRAHHASPGRAA